VQHFAEGLGWSSEVKAFSWSVIVGTDERIEALVFERCEIGFARNEAAHAADGVFDPALLPRRVGIAEEGLDGETMKRAMACELGSVVEGYGSAQLSRQTGEEGKEMLGDRLGSLGGRPGGKEEAGLALMDGEDRLAVSGEQHEVGFPMPGVLRLEAAIGRLATETRPSMKVAELPPLRPRKPRLLLARGR